MRALITGGAGFIGSHLAEALLDRGDHVLVLDDLSTGRFENIAHLQPHPRFEVAIDSVTNEPLVAGLIDRCDAVFHLAATVGVQLVMSSPVRTIETNTHGTEIVLRQATRRKRRVLVASTSEVYGKGVALPFRENADLVLGPSSKIRWGYAASKLVDEFLALAHWQEHQTPVVVVRLFNTVGPRQSSRYGMVIPNFVGQALAGRPLTVHGDGSQTRSFTWVGDVVDAMVGLIDAADAAGEVFNIGNGQEIRIRDLAHTIKTMTRSRSDIVFVPYRTAFPSSFEDMPRRVPDLSKIRRVIGYEPRVHLDEILRRTIQYWSSQGASDLARASMATRPAPMFAETLAVGSA